MQDSDHTIDSDRAPSATGEIETTDRQAAGADADAGPVAPRNEPPPQPPQPRARFRDRPQGWGRLTQSHSDDTAVRPVGTALREDGRTEDGRTEDGRTVERARVGTTRATTSSTARGRQRRGIFAGVLAVIVLLFALSRFVGGATSSAPTAVPLPTPVPFAVVNGAPITATAVLGVDAGLKEPREAVELPNGRIAVADTDNGRLAILDNKGGLVASITKAATAFQQPFALATNGRDLYVLDATRGAIERFDTGGHFVREIAHDSVLLQDARGLSVNRSGLLYVANPRANAVITFSPDGKVVKQMTSPLGDGPITYNQPSDIAVAHDYSLYIYDDGNTRIKKEKSSGYFVTQLQAPPSDTLHSVHVLPLLDGRLVASDPTGALVVYPATGGTPTRRPLRVPGQPLSPVSPLGLSRLSDGAILVSDDTGNRLLVVRLP